MTIHFEMGARSEDRLVSWDCDCCHLACEGYEVCGASKNIFY